MFRSFEISKSGCAVILGKYKYLNVFSTTLVFKVLKAFVRSYFVPMIAKLQMETVKSPIATV